MSEEQTYKVFEWINKDYLTKVLESHEAVTVNISEHEVKHATAKGEGYLGAMFRATVKYSIGTDKNQKTISLIIKAQLEDSSVSEIAEEFNIFERESQAYKCIIKDCMKILKETGDDTVFAPRYYSAKYLHLNKLFSFKSFLHSD